MGLFGSSTKQQHTQPDTLFSDDIMEVVLAVSEGPIVGLDTPRDFFINDTPLVNSSYTPNIGNFDLRIHKGNNPGEVFKTNLGGAGSTVNLNVNLETNLPVVGSGTKRNIDFLEVRIVIQRLYATNARGEWPWWADFKIEVKPHSSGTWAAGIDFSTPPPAVTTTTNYVQYTGQNQNPGEDYNAYYRLTKIDSAAPSAPTDFSLIWFNSASNYTPKIWNGTAWVAPPGLVYTYVALPDYSYYTWNDGNYVPNGSGGYNFAATGSTVKAIIGWNGAPPVFGNPQDLWVTPSNVLDQTSPTVYSWNGSTWVDYMDWAEIPSASPGTFSVYGKTTSNYVKEYRIPVPRINDTFDVRVTKLSAPNTGSEFSDIMFESFQEVTTDPLQFNDIAIAHLTVRASEQFSSIPTFTGIYKGRMVRVPSNYNPVTKVYTGLWDGVTFNIAWTDNPAWIVYDLVTNTRYGMAAYYTVNLDRMSIYEFGKHCDTHGFTYNELIQEPRNLVEAIDYICGIAGGRFIDLGNGYATILFDADDQAAVALFTPENVVDGVFTYGFTDITSRKNDITVSFINPDLNWREDRRRIYDQTIIDTYGRNPEEFIAVGCISETEAIKRGRLRLIMAQTERAVVTFKTNRLGLYLRPFDVILIADDASGFGIHGRVKVVNSTTSLTLRDAVYFEAGFTYKISFQVPDGNGNNQIVQHNLVTSSGSTTSLTLATPLTVTLPTNAAFSIECSTTTTGTPKAFRVTSIEESDGDADVVTVSAMEVNRTKWAYVDGTITVIDVGDGGRPTRFVDPPANPIAVGRSVSATRQEIHISWDTSPNRFVRSYNLYWSFNTGQTELLGTSRTPAYVIEDAKEGFYSFALTAVSIDGVESPPVYFEHRVLGISGTSRAVAPPSFIQLTNGSSATEFRGREPSISWGNSGDPFFLNFNVRVLHPSTSVTLREFNTRGNTYTYPYLDNQTDFGGTASRSMIFEVRALDSTGMYSMPVRLTASNPAPGLVSPSIVSNTNGIAISFSAPADADVSGSVVWCSTTNGFNPLATTPDYEGPNTSVFLDKPAGTYYIRVGCYDAFGRIGMNITSQVTIGVSDEIDLTPPATPTGLTLTPSTVVKADGTLDSVITLTWTANNEPDLAGYLIQIKEGASGNFIEFDTSLTRYEFHNLTPGVSYTAKIAAFDKSNNKSSFTATVSATASLNTTPPGSVTAFSATSSLQTNFLTWTNPANSDLAYVEVWMATTNNRASAAIVAKVNGTSFTHSGLTTNQSYFYWLRPVNTSGTVAAAYTPTSATGGLSATPGTLSGVEFNTSLRPIESVATLPTSGNFDGRIAYLTTDKKIYRYNGTAWVSTVPTTDLTGFVANTQINDRTISGTKLVTGAITSAEMLAGAVTASKIAASTIHSLLPNPTFEDGVMYPWTTAFGTNYVEAATDNASGLYRLVLQRTYDIGGGQLAAYVYANAFSVTAGDVLQAEFRIKGTSNSSGGAYLRLTWLDSAKANVGYSDAVSNGAFTTTWTVYGGQVTVPANARYAQLEIYHYVQSSSTYMLVDQVVVRPTFGANAIGNASISTAKIQDSAITAAQIASASISTAKIQDSAITPAQIATGAISTVKIQDSAVTAGQIATNAVTADKIAANSVSADKIAANTITAGQLAANAVTADKIAANSITATKLVLVDNTILGPDPGFYDLAWWSLSGVSGYTAYSGSTSPQPQRFLGVTRLGESDYISTPFQIEQGAYYRLKLRIWISTDAAGWIGLSVHIPWTAWAIPYPYSTLASVDSSGYPLINLSTTTITKGQWVEFESIYQASAAQATYLQFRTRHNLSAGSFQFKWEVTRAVSAGLVVDGSIITSKLSANAVTADKIAANTITGDRIAANTINADRIIANTITATQIAAATITGDRLVANTITAGQIAANTITAGQIAANTITASQIAADTITAGQIAAGAITASELAAGSVLASKIGVGISRNMALNSDTAAGTLHYELGWRNWSGSPTPQYTVSWDPWQPLGMKAIALYVPGNPSGIQDIYHKPKTVGNSYQLFPIVAGQRYEFSYYVSVHRCDAYAALLFFGDDGSTQLLYVAGDAVGSNGASGRLASWPRASVFATAPSNAAYVMPIIRAAFSAAQSDPYIFFTAVHFGDATPNQTELTPWSPAGGTIIDGTRIVTGTLNADKIIAGTITGDRFNTGTSLPGTITVGSTGVSIDTVQSRSSDPAARINAVGTTIDPGRILISGSTTLASWRNGSDTTKIEGGAIYANSITANKLRIGNRGINTVALDFEVEKYTNGTGRLKWTAGYILYEDDDGVMRGPAISAGYVDYATLNNWLYIYWTKGATTLSTTNDWPTASTGNNIMLASWTAYAGLAVTYGGVIIDGTRITAGTITADRIAANSITAGQIAAETITGTQLAPLTIKASNLLVTGENKVLDPFFDSDEWVLDSGLYFESNAQWVNIGVRRYAVWWSGAGGGPGGGRKHLYSRNWIRVSPGQKYRIRAKMWNGGNCGFYLGVNFYDSSGGYLGGNFNSVSPGFNGYFSFGNIVPPANTAYGLIYIFNDTAMSGVMLVSDISFGQMVGTAFIEDAAISNAKIGNLEVDNIKIANGAVTTVVAAGTGEYYNAIATVTITVRANAKILLTATAGGGLAAGSTNGAGSISGGYLDILDSGLTTLYSRVLQAAVLTSISSAGGDNSPAYYNYSYIPAATQYVYVASTSGTFTFKARGQGVTVLTAVELAK